MCGIAGIVEKNNGERENLEKVKKMTASLAHRGPDGDGHWMSEDGQIVFGHRRLSIIDLSDAGTQPMHYLGRYTITFNGEIYNYIELKELCLKQGYTFSTQTDTEVIMALYDWKKEGCLDYFDGMFAFALYDEKEKKIFAARDRFGEKPFYYYHLPGKLFAFASEMKGLWAAGIERKVNNRMMYNYLAFQYIDNPSDYSETFFEHILRLPHSHYLLIDVTSLTVVVKRYWDINYEFTDRSIDITQAKEKFRDLFYTSVNRRLRSDVPVGSSLSGGLDSSIVVSVIEDINKKKRIKQSTFSAIFPGFEKDESKYINILLKNLNVDPHFTEPDAEIMMKELKRCFYHQEEPFGSASILAQFEVLKLVKQNNVTVLLDGQGADELLAGYHFFYSFYFEELKKTNPQLFNEELQGYKKIVNNNTINPLPQKNLRYYVRKWSGPAKDTLKKIDTAYRQWTNPYFDSDFFNEYKNEQFIFPRPASTLNQALYNSVNEGMTQLLRYADRNSMAHSREIRLPFLYHELVEFLFSLPPGFKIHNGWTKYIQRISFEDILPQEITWRKDKIGYEPPQKKWLSEPKVQEEINEARNLLISSKFINKKIKDKPVTAVGQGEGGGVWREWMAGLLLTNTSTATSL